MKSTIKDKVTAIGFTAVLAAALIANIALPDKEVSESERRLLEKLPELTAGSVFEGDYFEELEDYALDHFVLRDTFRTVKSAVRLNVFMQMESNDLFIRDGGIYKVSPELNESAVAGNCERVYNTAQKIWPDANMYYCIIPEKNTYLDVKGYPMFDAEGLEAIAAQKFESAQKIDISDLLSLDSYYATDPHWRQEKIVDAADRILAAMGNPAADRTSSEQHKAADFYGTYRGQLPLGAGMDELNYLTDEKINGVTVYDYETGRTTAVYVEEKLQAMDPYDFFLSGARALLRIDNPNASSDRELVIFRDSFGSSIAPLLIGEYSTVYLVDMRYMTSAALEQNITAGSNTDLLFLYCQTLLNNNGVFRP